MKPLTDMERIAEVTVSGHVTADRQTSIAVNFTAESLYMIFLN